MHVASLVSYLSTPKVQKSGDVYKSSTQQNEHQMSIYTNFEPSVGGEGGGGLNRLLPAGCTVKTYFSRTHNNTTYAGYQINEKKNTKTPQLLLPGRIDRQNGRPGDLMTKLETTGKTGRVGKYKSTHSH